MTYLIPKYQILLYRGGSKTLTKFNHHATSAAQLCYLTTFHPVFMLLNWPDLFFVPLLRNFAPERANNWMAQRRIRSRESARKHVCQLSLYAFHSDT